MAGEHTHKVVGTYCNLDGTPIEIEAPPERPLLPPVVVRRVRRGPRRSKRAARAGPDDDSEPPSPNALAHVEPYTVASAFTDADRRMIDFLIEEALAPWL